MLFINNANDSQAFFSMLPVEKVLLASSGSVLRNQFAFYLVIYF